MLVLISGCTKFRGRSGIRILPRSTTLSGQSWFTEIGTKYTLRYSITNKYVRSSVSVIEFLLSAP